MKVSNFYFIFLSAIIQINFLIWVHTMHLVFVFVRCVLFQNSCIRRKFTEPFLDNYFKLMFSSVSFWLHLWCSPVFSGVARRSFCSPPEGGFAAGKHGTRSEDLVKLFVVFARFTQQPLWLDWVDKVACVLLNLSHTHNSPNRWIKLIKLPVFLSSNGRMSFIPRDAMACHKV